MTCPTDVVAYHSNPKVSLIIRLNKVNAINSLLNQYNLYIQKTGKVSY